MDVQANHPHTKDKNMHQYQQEFNTNFELGFSLSEYPFLVDKSWHNDACPSFYLKKGEQYLVLWVDHTNPNDREGNTARYTVQEADNEGGSDVPELYCGNNEVIFESDSISKLNEFLGQQCNLKALKVD